MRILFILENYAPHVGGVETVFRTLCERLAKEGHVVTVLTHHIPGTALRERIHGVDIRRVRCMDSRYIFTFAAVVQGLRLAKDADIIHTTTFNGAPPAWLCARLRGRPVIITVHETWIGKWRTYSNFGPLRAFVHDMLERLVFLPRFDRYVCVSRSTALQLAQAKRAIKDRITTVYNGFDLTPWMTTPATRKKAAALRKRLGLQDSYVVLGYGRPGTSKGFAYLVRAFPMIRQRVSNARLVLILSDAPQYRPELDRLKTEAAMLMRTTRKEAKSRTHAIQPGGIIFLPSQRFSDLVTHVQMADCVVMPSLTEGFGYAAIEAAAAGVPVVATDGTSLPEVACGTHVLVGPADPNAIAQGVVAVREGHAGKTALRTFSWEKTVSGYEREYERLVGRGDVSRVSPRSRLPRRTRADHSP